MVKSTFLFLLILISLNLNAQDKVNFSENFKKENQGQYKIEINEVKELVHIMLAITKSGLGNDDMFQQKGQYYQDLLAYFKPYQNEKIIKTFDSLMIESPYNYIFLTGNAISYDFKGNRKVLVKSKIYEFPATGIADVEISVNPISTYEKDIENFAEKSNFRTFYKNHKKYYAEIIADYDKNANVGNQWKWLEKNFKTKINSYTIFCSPLINGLNYTGEFNNNNFKLIYMVLPPLDNYPKLTAIQNEVLNTRVMFTEIDHNYVNPPSNANEKIINELFKDRKIWTDEKVYGISAYPNAIKVFNEYMTFGVFLLYCEEHYDGQTFINTSKEVIALMRERGFPKMQEFTEKLLKIKSENPQQKIDDIYPGFLKLFEN